MFLVSVWVFKFRSIFVHKTPLGLKRKNKKNIKIKIKIDLLNIKFLRVNFLWFVKIVHFSFSSEILKKVKFLFEKYFVSFYKINFRNSENLKQKS